MSITDRQRTNLPKAAEESMGAEPADTMMALLPPVGWADVATKHDLSEVERRMHLRFGQLSSEIKGEIGQVRSEMGRLRAELKGEIATQGTKFEASLRQVSTRLLFGMLTSNAAIAALFFTATRAGA